MCDKCSESLHHQSLHQDIAPSRRSAMLFGAAAFGMAFAGGWPGISVPFAAVWLGAAYVLANTPAGERAAAILGQTWRVCPFAIAMLSVPAFIAIFWALRGLAPTRLRLAGAMGGLLSGAVATLVYCLHCPEMGVAFWGVWYVLGMLVPTAIGALLGPRLLRW